jgi:hypothetical protein
MQSPLSKLVTNTCTTKLPYFHYKRGACNQNFQSPNSKITRLTRGAEGAFLHRGRNVA